MQTEKGKNSRERIIEISARLFLEKGYSGTGLSEILKESKMTKGSFYFYFTKKEELAVAVAEYFKLTYCQWMKDCLENSSTWRGFIENLSSDIKRQIQAGTYQGCPFSSFGTELGMTIPEVSKVCVEALHELHQIFCAALIRDGQKEEQNVAKCAMQALTMYEGFLVYYRIAGTLDCIDAMTKSLYDVEEWK